MNRKVMITIGALLAAGCSNSPSGSESKKESEGFKVTSPAPAKAAAPAAAAAAVVDSVKEEGELTRVVLTSTDAMAFGTKEIRVKAGQTIAFELHHTGKLAKEVMGHNFVLLAAGTDKNAFAAEAMKAQETAYIPESQKDSVLAHTGIIGGGETDKIEFKTPAAGTYDFICSFPGHAMLMNGKFIVE